MERAGAERTGTGLHHVPDMSHSIPFVLQGNFSGARGLCGVRNYLMDSSQAHPTALCKIRGRTIRYAGGRGPSFSFVFGGGELRNGT